jgi:plastocyanin
MRVRLAAHHPYLVAGGLLAAAVGVAQSPAPARAADAGLAAKIAGFAFAPPTITVHAGETVTWTNADDDPHTVYADNGAFKSRALDTGDSFIQTFAAPGVYSYHCSLHPYMVGKVVVQR